MQMISKNSLPLPTTPALWLEEIILAIANAIEARRQMGNGQTIVPARLFLLAPGMCLKYRGLEIDRDEAERVFESVLATYGANYGRSGLCIDSELRPCMTFALGYIATHLALNLVGEDLAHQILWYCDQRLERRVKYGFEQDLDGTVHCRQTHGSRVWYFSGPGVSGW